MMQRRLPDLPVRMKFGFIRFHPVICTQNINCANRALEGRAPARPCRIFIRPARTGGSPSLQERSARQDDALPYRRKPARKTAVLSASRTAVAAAIPAMSQPFNP